MFNQWPYWVLKARQKAIKEEVEKMLMDEMLTPYWPLAVPGSFVLIVNVMTANPKKSHLGLMEK